MKKITTFLIAALVAGSFTAANAGGMAEPIIEGTPEVVEAANASFNPAYLLLGLLGLALLGSVSSSTSSTPET